MKPIVKGMFARSLAGHDKGKLYVICLLYTSPSPRD